MNRPSRVVWSNRPQRRAKGSRSRDGAGHRAGALGLSWVVAVTMLLGGAVAAASTTTVAPSTRLMSFNSAGDRDGRAWGFPDISADGGLVVFHSDSRLSAQDLNDHTDVYVSDGTTVSLVSAVPGGQAGDGPSDDPMISGDGRFVAFRSTATNLTSTVLTAVPRIYIRDLSAATTTRLVTPSSAAATQPAISHNGRFVAFVSQEMIDQDNQPVISGGNVWVHDRQDGGFELVTVGLDGQGWGGNRPSISDDGNVVAFMSDSDQYFLGDSSRTYDIFVRDLAADTTVLASVSSGDAGVPGNGVSSSPHLSGDGSTVAFSSRSTNLTDDPMPSDPWTGLFAFAHNVTTKVTTLVGVSSTGIALDDAVSASVNLDGSVIAFSLGTSPTNDGLPEGNGSVHVVYARDVAEGTNEAVSVSDGSMWPGSSFGAAVDSSGRFIAFRSDDAYIDGTRGTDTLLRDRGAGGEPGTPTHQLTVATDGTGTGSATPDPMGVSCGTNCYEYAENTLVTLTVQAASDSTFSGWSGACTGTSATCQVPMDQARSVTATFALDPVVTHDLTVSITGSGAGSVEGSPVGVSCGTGCFTYDEGTVVMLTALPSSTSTFAGWSGDCTGTATTCEVTMTAARSVTANFTTISTLPDLVASVTSPPGQLRPGQSFAVTAATTNDGTATSAASTTRLYLSGDQTRSEDDRAVAGTRVGRLSPGQTRETSLRVTMPSDTPHGEYWLIACADDKGAIDELAEDNNCSATATPVAVDDWPADLVVKWANGPAWSVRAGRPAAFSALIRNEGLKASPRSVTRFWLRRGSDPDVLLGDTRTPGVAPGTARRIATRFRIPAGVQAGQYHVVACADVAAEVQESSEDNNCTRSVRTFTVRR